jgi:hypothetical protein
LIFVRKPAASLDKEDFDLTIGVHQRSSAANNDFESD